MPGRSWVGQGSVHAAAGGAPPSDPLPTLRGGGGQARAGGLREVECGRRRAALADGRRSGMGCVNTRGGHTRHPQAAHGDAMRFGMIASKQVQYIPNQNRTRWKTKRVLLQRLTIVKMFS